MASIVNKKLPAATILETLVALTILLVLFGIATSLLVQVSLNGNAEKVLKASQLLKKWSAQTRTESAYFDDNISEEGFLLERVVEKAAVNDNMLQLHYTAYDTSRKLLIEWKELVINEKE